VDDIVETEPIPPKFLESILTELRKEGLLLSRRGPAGGYRLARAPEAISLAAVVRTLDGAFAPTTCARLRNPVCCEGCVDMEQCAIRPFARRVRDEMAKVLEGQSIRDLSEDAAHEGQSSKERAKP
jgi:Rrf2 family protein